MDDNSVLAYWVHGLRGVVSGLDFMVEQRVVPSEGTLQSLDEYILRLTEQSESLRKNLEQGK